MPTLAHPRSIALPAALTLALPLIACEDEPSEAPDASRYEALVQTVDGQRAQPMGTDQPPQPETRDPSEFGTWSGDDDAIGQSEFDELAGQVEVYDQWDIDGDGRVEDSEFNLVVHHIWDTDESGMLDRDEWESATLTWYTPDADHGAWEDWDLNDDGYISQDEHAVAMKHAAMYQAWSGEDQDMNAREFVERSFVAFDEDDDGEIEPSEWDSALVEWVEPMGS